MHQRKGAPRKKKSTFHLQTEVGNKYRNMATHNFYKSAQQKTPIIIKHYFNILLLTLTFTGPCIVIYFYSKTNQMHQCL